MVATLDLPPSEYQGRKALALGLVRRRQLRRAAQRRRALARVVIPILPNRLTTEAYAGPASFSTRHVAQRGWPWALALALHLAALGVGRLAQDNPPVPPPTTQTVTIELQELPPSSLSTPTVTLERPRAQAPKRASQTPNRPKPATPAPQAPEPMASPSEPTSPPPRKPLRVVGLSLESTSATANGPSFAVGNTRMGDTAAQATDPSHLTPYPAATNRRAAWSPHDGSTMTKPVRRQLRQPVYPELLRARGLEADVVVVVEIDATGMVTSVTLVKPAAEAAFNEAAQQTAWQERFTPAMKDGEPTPTSLQFTYSFRLTS